MRTRHDHTGQDLAALTRLLHDLATDMPPGHRQRLKDHLVTETRRSEARHSPVPRLPRVTSLRGHQHRRPRVILAAAAGVVGLATAATAIGIASQGGPALPPPSKGAVHL